MILFPELGVRHAAKITCFRNHVCQGRDMAERRARGGRPSKGERGHLVSRPPADLDQAVREEADRLGLYVSDYIANVLAEKLGFPPVAAPTASTAQLQMTA